MSLPQKDTQEWDKEVEFYKHSTPEERERRAKELGYLNANVYGTSMNRRGVKLDSPETPSAEKDAPPIIVLPELEIKKYVPINSGRVGDPETAVLHWADHHYGQITKSFNKTVYDQRLEHIFQSTMRITNLHRNMYPINDMVVLITGDMVHGENAHQGAKVGGVECGAREQVIGILPKLSEFLLGLKEQFKTVEVHCVRGNHGRYDRVAPATSNWDMMLYDQLQTKLERYSIKVEVADDFYKIVEIQGHRFFLVHLDQFKASQGVPWFAMTKGIQSWYVTYDGFEYVVGGHFHKDDYLRLTSKCKLLMGGSMVTDDSFTQEIIKTSSIPCQWLFGVHKNKGITWPYSLIVDDKYLPKTVSSGR